MAPDFSLGPDTTLDAFRKSALVADAQVAVNNPPYVTLYVAVTEPGTRRLWGMFLCFEHEKLRTILMSDQTHYKPELQWNEAAERKKKLVHDRWLRKHVGSAKRQTRSWGTVESYYSHRDTESGIGLNYGLLTSRRTTSA